MENDILGVENVSNEAIRAYVQIMRKGKETQQSLAKAIGYAYSTYRDWEQGKTLVTDVDMLVRVFGRLGAPLDDLRFPAGDGVGKEDGQKVAQERLKTPGSYLRELAALITEDDKDIIAAITALSGENKKVLAQLSTKQQEALFNLARQMLDRDDSSQ